MDEDDLKKLKGINFHITDEMKENLFNTMVIQKMLENEELSKKERKQLEKEKERLVEEFRRGLHENNPVEVSLVRTFLQMKNDERK